MSRHGDLFTHYLIPDRLFRQIITMFEYSKIVGYPADLGRSLFRQPFTRVPGFEILIDFFRGSDRRGDDLVVSINRLMARIHLLQGNRRIRERGESGMGTITLNEIIGWNDIYGNILCLDCGNSQEDKPLTEDDFEDDDVIECDGCGARIF